MPPPGGFAQKQAEELGAAQFIAETVAAEPGEVTIVGGKAYLAYPDGEQARTELSTDGRTAATLLVSLAHQPITMAMVYGEPQQFRQRRALFIAAPIVLSLASLEVNERDGSATFEVQRTGSTAGAASVDYATFDGGALCRRGWVCPVRSLGRRCRSPCRRPT